MSNMEKIYSPDQSGGYKTYVFFARRNSKSCLNIPSASLAYLSRCF